MEEQAFSFYIKIALTTQIVHTPYYIVGKGFTRGSWFDSFGCKVFQTTNSKAKYSFFFRFVLKQQKGFGLG